MEKGYWIPIKEKWPKLKITVEVYKCSKCGEINLFKDNYCSNCGDKKDGQILDKEND